jgi:hypothetical protein
MKKITMQENKSALECKSFEEEREDLESRGPLAKGYKSVLNRPESNQNRTSFLSVRLTGEELDKLGFIARGRGVGPSTYARMALLSIIEQSDRAEQPENSDQLCEKMVTVMPQSLKDQLTDFSNNVKLPDINNPGFLILDPKQMAEFWTISIRVMQYLFSKLTGTSALPGTKEDAGNSPTSSDKSAIKNRA